jgi:D-alanyl-lipoteichoic acid acyltransferase DltB (MBOAT superfamily)
MLFNSYAFLFAYLPIVLGLFFALGTRRPTLAAGWLTLASLAFYAYWSLTYLGLLAGSIAFNYLVGSRIARAAEQGRERQARGLLWLGLAGDLGTLGYYKYANFFLDNVNAIAGSDLRIEGLVLPLGISFFTFTQIAFLVDACQGKAREYNPVHYALFVTYFPHLIAGPILHHKEMMPQFAEPATYRRSAENLAVGLTLFVIGLVKKVVLADGIAPYATEGFTAASQGENLLLLQAWGAALAYTLQLYFDFSGYSDMAVGLSRMIGVRLPLNFDSPYKATSIIDFWRRWHMTLSRFLRDYLYIPLGGSRHGPMRRYANLLATMLLGGLWHGASWTFVVWGGLHGVYLAVNHAWRALRGGGGRAAPAASRVGRTAGWALTFLAVVVGWVVFRSPDLDTAGRVLAGMAGLNGVSLPSAFGHYLGAARPVLEAAGVQFTLGGGSRFLATYAWIAVLLPLALLAPNSQQILARHRPALDPEAGPLAEPPRDDRRRLAWEPSRGWATAVAAATAVAVLSLTRPTEFLYFQF